MSEKKSDETEHLWRLTGIDMAHGLMIESYECELCGGTLETTPSSPDRPDTA